MYSQALKVIERCSKPEDAQQNLEKLANKFKDKNYPDDLVEKKILKAKRVNIETLLRQRKSTKTDNKVRMIFTHNVSNPPINQWIRESKKYLVKNDQAKQMGELVGSSPRT